MKKFNVLFVCLGNICRSPTADGVFRKYIENAGLSDQVHVDSAGTAAWHIGKSPDPRSTEAAYERGFDLSFLKARQVSEQDFEDFDLLLAMDEDNFQNLMAIAPDSKTHKVQKLLTLGSLDPTGDVPDPYYGGSDGFERVLDLVEDACAGLLERIKKDI